MPFFQSMISTHHIQELLSRDLMENYNQPRVFRDLINTDLTLLYSHVWDHNPGQVPDIEQDITLTCLDTTSVRPPHYINIYIMPNYSYFGKMYGHSKSIDFTPDILCIQFRWLDYYLSIESLSDTGDEKRDVYKEQFKHLADAELEYRKSKWNHSGVTKLMYNINDTATNLNFATDHDKNPNDLHLLARNMEK